MTVGMSAPPMGMISRTPNTSASRMMTGKSMGAHAAVGWSTSATPAANAIPNSARLVTFCSG